MVAQEQDSQVVDHQERREDLRIGRGAQDSGRGQLAEHLPGQGIPAGEQRVPGRVARQQQPAQVGRYRGIGRQLGQEHRGERSRHGRAVPVHLVDGREQLVEQARDVGVHRLP